MGPPVRSPMVGEWRTAQYHPGDRPGVQDEPDTREAHPRPRVRVPSPTCPQVVVHPICHT